MVSTIVENKPNEFMSIKHLGTIKNGVEDLDNEENKQWAGAFKTIPFVNPAGKRSCMSKWAVRIFPKNSRIIFADMA
jgi:hypothetical protein